jgi:hypothetical protein
MGHTRHVVSYLNLTTSLVPIACFTLDCPHASQRTSQAVVEGRPAGVTLTTLALSPLVLEIQDFIDPAECDTIVVC